MEQFEQIRRDRDREGLSIRGLEVTGAILYVSFILAIVHLAGAGERFAGRIVALAAAILVGLTLLDSAMIISAVQSAQHGRPKPSASAST